MWIKKNNYNNSTSPRSQSSIQLEQSLLSQCAKKTKGIFLPFKIAKKHIESSNATTSDIINLVIKKQKVSITQEELNILVQLPGVSFNLPLNKETKKVFDELIKVNLNKERGLPGVYIWTHLPTGDKYVGSSNSLASRFNIYWSLLNNPKYQAKYKSGKLVSRIINEGDFHNFKLEIFVISQTIHTNISKFSHNFLEQYYLLSSKDFNLNTQLLVNFRANQGKILYIYNKDKSILLYQSPSKIVFIIETGISHKSINEYLNKALFLNNFYITDELLIDAIPSRVSSYNIRSLIDKQRKSCAHYLFNEDYSILYYRGKTMSTLRKDLGIDGSIVNKSIKNNSLYLNTFRISNDKSKISYCFESKMGINELRALLKIKREQNQTNNNPVYIYNGDLTVLYYKTNTTGELSKDLGINFNDGDNIKNYIDIPNSRNTGYKTVLGLALSYNLIPETVEKYLSLREMKELVSSRKNKTFGKNSTISIECLSTKKIYNQRSLRRTIRFLKEKGINTTLTTLNTYIDTGKPFKGYLFKYLK